MSPDDFSKEQLMAVCTIYMDRCTAIRGLLTAQLAAMPDLKTCKSVEAAAAATHEAYSSAVEAMLNAVERIDRTTAEMLATIGIAVPLESGPPHWTP